MDIPFHSTALYIHIIHNSIWTSHTIPYHGGYSTKWTAKLLCFTNLYFPDIRGCSLLSHLLWWKTRVKSLYCMLLNVGKYTGPLGAQRQSRTSCMYAYTIPLDQWDWYCIFTDPWMFDFLWQSSKYTTHWSYGKMLHAWIILIIHLFCERLATLKRKCRL